VSRVTCHMSISLDGFVAGPDQSIDDPIGVGGIDLHHWHLKAEHPVDVAFTESLMASRGAYVMGRNMFGPIRGDWDEGWRGWWGDEPPYHAPVFVLTHFPRESIEMEGGTTFHFVTTGLEDALAQAKEVAGDMDVDVAGGASTVRQALAGDAIDELVLDFVPILLGRGERIFDESTKPQFEIVEAIHSPNATHVRYRVVR
jgi:dihydrofolate reductase